MMGLYRSMAGQVRVSIVSPDGLECMRCMEQAEIALFSVHRTDSVTTELTVNRRDLPSLQQLCDRKGYVLRIQQKKGIFWPLRSVLTRPVFTVGMVLLVILASVLPGRILFISTEGNDTVPTRSILESAGECGLKFWSRRRGIRSEQIKNSLLEDIPQLQWVGVNTYGCRAVITVRERAETNPVALRSPVCHIVAAQDGIIQSTTVTLGTGNCAVGQAVRKGDVLISGFTDCGITIVGQQAEGEILAQTKHDLRILTPVVCGIQTPNADSDTKFSLLIGKKRINFYKGSGISGATCDKMYSKYVLKLPGGFELPVALLKECTVSCDLTEACVQNPEQMLKEFASVYLMEQMTAGTILRKEELLTEREGLFQLDGSYDCQENIGIVQDEMIGDSNG